jgi:hypothetical protein
MRLLARTLIVLGAGAIGGMLAWQVTRPDAADGGTASGGGDARAPEGRTRVRSPARAAVGPRAEGTPARQAAEAPGGARPLVRRDPDGPRPDWDDAERDPGWAPAMEQALHEVAGARLAEDFPEVRWVAAACRTRMCSVHLEAPVEGAALLRDYLGGMIQIDEVVVRVRAGDAAAPETAELVLDLWLPEPRMAPHRLAAEQARADVMHPHIRQRQRAWLERVRREQGRSR